MINTIQNECNPFRYNLTLSLKFCFSPIQYSARIEENTLSSELLRFQIIDWDEEFTDNWLAVFDFTSGNEGNWFEIQTDPRTNEGILKVVKVRSYFPSVVKTFYISQNYHFYK